jgi:hypothetical protein
MDERSILLMSEELRAAMGDGVKKLDEAVSERQDSRRTVPVLGRLIRYAALKSGRIRVTFESHAQLDVHRDLRAPFVMHLADKSAEMDIAVRAVKSATVTRGEPFRYTLIVDAQTHK